MTIWSMYDPRDGAFAHFTEESIWEATGDDANACPGCGRGPQLLRSGLLRLQWEPGSDQIGDFSWDESGSYGVITDRVHELLREHVRGYDAGLVEMFQDPKVKAPKRMSKRTKKRIWLPYEGPRLFELVPTTWVHMDTRRTSANLIRRCEACGDTRWELTGYEKHTCKGEWRNGQYSIHEIHEPRIPGEGLFAHGSDLRDSDIFKVHEFPGWLFCTNRAKEFIENHEITNITFVEMGEVI